MLIIFFINFVLLNALPISLFNNPSVYKDNVVDRNVSRISASDCDWLADHCGKRNNDQQFFKIFGGQPAQLGELPWVVFVSIRYTKAIHPWNEASYVKPAGGPCSGTLISKSHVLTAAHCFFNEQLVYTSEDDFDREYTTETTFKARVVTGAVDLRLPNIRIHEERARIISPDYNATGDIELIYDYAIIEIDPPLNESEMADIGSTTRPACLPENRLPLAGSFYIAGWGETETNSASNTLQTVTVEMKDCVQFIKDATSSEPLKPLCTTGLAGFGDSGAGYFQRIDGQTTVVAVHHGRFGRLTNETIQNVAVVLAPLDPPGHRHIPLKWIQDNIWP